jgi:hypothetical protein
MLVCVLCNYLDSFASHGRPTSMLEEGGAKGGGDCERVMLDEVRTGFLSMSLTRYRLRKIQSMSPVGRSITAMAKTVVHQYRGERYYAAASRHQCRSMMTFCHPCRSKLTWSAIEGTTEGRVSRRRGDGDRTGSRSEYQLGRWDGQRLLSPIARDEVVDTDTPHFLKICGPTVDL